jgi:membrane fusion protein (multidrug efflux system)
VVAALLAAACGPQTPPAPPPVDVVVADVVQRDVPITSEWIGTTQGLVDAQVRAQVSGYLISRDYREGSLVKEGDLLFVIDPRPYRAALEAAQGQLGRAQAALTKAEQDVARYTPLAKEGAVSQQELDDAIQARNAGRAAVQSARADLDKAKLDLAFTDIRSPITGIAGIAQAQVGDLVGPSTSEPLTVVSQMDPIQVVFPVSEREYLSYVKRRQAPSEQSQEQSQAGTLRLVLADGSIYPHPGHVTVAGRAVDPKTGTLLLKGEFPNPGNVLRPGQYARVQAVLETRKAALLVPQRAVQELQGTYQVAVVGPDQKVEMRVVEPGPRTDGSWVIDKGLEPGERVIVEGVQKVRTGVAVNPQPATAPAVAAPPPGREG